MDELAASWRCFDWRENFLAPGLKILQALTAEGATASGAGLTRDQAYARCIGETAEIAALARLRAQGEPFETTRDGIAAHRHSGPARDAALREAFERYSIAQWWFGRLPARPVAQDWLDQTGMARQLAQLRQGAALKRRTDWWLLQHPTGPCTMICRSTSLEGQDPVLGFGVHPDPARAAGKALRELLLMELNLMELLAARSHGDDAALHAVRDRIRGYAQRMGHLFAQGPAVIPLDRSAGPESRWFERPPRLFPVGGGASVAVWVCQPDLPVPCFSAMTGCPYF